MTIEKSTVLSCPAQLEEIKGHCHSTLLIALSERIFGKNKLN